MRVRAPSPLAVIIGIGKYNCTRSEERKDKELHRDGSVLSPEKISFKRNAELDQLNKRIEKETET